MLEIFEVEESVFRATLYLIVKGNIPHMPDENEMSMMSVLLEFKRSTIVNTCNLIFMTPMNIDWI